MGARAKFFSTLRSSTSAMFGSRFTSSQVEGIEAVLNAFAKHGDGRAKTLAYCLATKRREVGSKMQPVREGFKSSDLAAREYVLANYGHKGADWYCYPQGPHGHVYYGRGDVQHTWLDNYIEAEKRTGLPFVKNPDLMLDPEISSRMLVEGIIDGRWNRRGKGIAHYLPDHGIDDLKGARRTVNITNKWRLIGSYYTEFLAAIEFAGGVEVLAPRIAPRPAPKISFSSLRRFFKWTS